ncbi:hypothetical protein DEM26_18920 [Thioclava sp. NG1]|uniref:hypothetical protein n=1 Tax=Thioclava sp. NG1 TaxID=2182426 RepID=UPI000D603B81|nr:hypothetical protein [Thioclava sp. NG1]PWE48253.1 hypothetical protein DEM26_18920 [Thioclava sp. NG1]
MPGPAEIADGFLGCHVLQGDLEKIARDAGANFAQKREITVGNKRYLRGTLWSDFARGPGSVAVKSSKTDWVMNGYRYIRGARSNYRKARPADTIAQHHDHRE